MANRWCAKPKATHKFASFFLALGTQRLDLHICKSAMESYAMCWNRRAYTRCETNRAAMAAG